MILDGVILEEAMLRKRLNRFTVECILKERTVEAYLPNPGRLWEILLLGRLLYLRKNPSRSKIPYTVISTKRDGLPILLHTHLTNTVVEVLLKEKKIPGLEKFDLVKKEVSIGRSRFDFLLQGERCKLVLEVKNCTLFGRTLAMFPDAITVRGRRHLLELSKLKEKGIDGGILFVVWWPSAKYFLPEYHTDIDFSRDLLKVRDKILIKAIAVKLKKDLSLDTGVKELMIPWELLEREAQDRGCYVLILSIKEDCAFSVGELGTIDFRKGYYLYIGSAKRGLTKRIARHKRRRKKLFWHIDYLREHASFYKELPIRTNADLECEIATRLKEFADWTIPDFGSSGCACESHLFGMKEDPISSSLFINMLQDFRIGKLEGTFPKVPSL